jgi:hypothetical protein
LTAVRVEGVRSVVSAAFAPQAIWVRSANLKLWIAFFRTNTGDTHGAVPGRRRMSSDLTPPRRFPPPLSIEEREESFVVKDKAG